MLKKLNSGTFTALTLYASSTILFTLIDFIVIRYYSLSAVADWAFYKSLIFIGGGICILGFDQLVFRHAELYEYFKKQFRLQCLILATVITILVFIYRERPLEAFLMFFVLIFYSNSLFEAGFWRAKNSLVLSQLNTNLWKILMVIFSIISIYLNTISLVILQYFGAFFISFCILGIANSINIKNYSNEEKIDTSFSIKEFKPEYFFTGIYFFLHSFSLVIANYGEQLLLNIFEEKILSKEIFSYITMYSSLALAGIGFVGFYLGPIVRSRPAFNLEDYKKYTSIVIFFGLGLIFINCLIIYFLYPYFFNHILFDSLLWTLVLILTFFRVLYILPSLCLGVFGTNYFLKLSSSYSLLVVFIYIGLFSLILYLDAPNTKYIIVSIMILHWLLKVGISNYFVYKSLSLNKIGL